MERVRNKLHCLNNSYVFSLSIFGQFVMLSIFVPQKTYWNQPVHVSMCPSSFCQSTSGGIKSHLVTALVSFKIMSKRKKHSGKIFTKAVCFIYLVKRKKLVQQSLPCYQNLCNFMISVTHRFQN